jgi:protoheme IX farnesyltransferase
MRTKMNSGGEIVLVRSRFADYITLTKPELTLLSVLTAIAGFYLAATGAVDYLRMMHTFIGTALVGGGAGALNQYIERDFDRMMRRTENRPLPSGRLRPQEVLLFGIFMALAGIIELMLFTNTLTGFLAAATIVSYLFLYTPLKRITPFSTIVGGIPGALPPVMGWASARGELGVEAWILFAILFFWQMPHFFSLAWMYRKDYARAGFPMLTVLDEGGSVTSRQILLYCALLLPTAVLPTVVGLAGNGYLVAGIALGAAFLACGVALSITRSSAWARRVFFASLLYLPALFTVMSVDKL